ncbi:MAG: hypothetical protein JWN07_690, partial [Hyphomicrobiales bacterium]|nr:hypothetical protein [Hyphomicrobiales bacterium]
FAAVSPYPNSGVSATTFTLLSAAWLIAVHALASSVGGYIAGRLRTSWTGLHTDEVYFRDTAHGFLSWAVGILIGGFLIGSVLTSAIGTGAQSAASAFGPAAQSAVQQSGVGSNASSTMMLDRLFRSDRPSPDANDQNARAEVGRIMANAVTTGTLPQDDKAYVAQMIATRTGLSQPDAEKRIDDAINTAKATAEKARKGAMYASLWSVIALLIGGFCASAFAAYAGTLRDD